MAVRVDGAQLKRFGLQRPLGIDDYAVILTALGTPNALNALETTAHLGEIQLSARPGIF